MTEATRQTRSDNTAVRTFQSGFPETELFDPMDRARHQELQGHEEALEDFTKSSPRVWAAGSVKRSIRSASTTSSPLPSSPTTKP